LLGGITNNYSDRIEKGLVISQTPVVNTSYEKDGKIDLVISLGKEIINTPAPTQKPSKGKKRSTNLPLAMWVAL
jgi:beta-lactam-binding protein with PASTA domain